MLRNLEDAWGWIKNLNAKVDRIFSGAFLENASITNGRLRIIGGTLRVDSGGSVVIVGTLSIDGTTTVTGSFKVTGPWRLEGDGTITGNVVGTGTLTWNGPWNFNGAGNITGNVEMTGNLNVQGAGRVKVGGMTLDPTISGGAVTFPNGAQVFTNGSTIQVYLGNGVVQVSDAEVKMQLGGTALRLTSGHIYGAGMATKAVGTVPGGFVGAIVYDAGEWKRLI
ncbi:hypothetical protein MOX01_22230 [Microbacterium oxydans]|uniref:hypothetical protein n=1 Tax=Microbacterium oxydans TaxID=82380 RepID=UPI001171C2B2|nr:hypothetical protein [Microbacterium oxydans]GED39081.1 hypothetical protein MOX01_22230 [Microbacterium oxydans]